MRKDSARNHELRRIAWGPNPWIGSIASTTSRYVALTFDDGPDPNQTPVVLKSLATYGATATFFVLLTRVRKYPDIVRALLDGGHEVGLHGPDHADLTRIPPADVLRRTCDAKEELEEFTGQPVRWFRAPYGRLSPSSIRAVNQAGLTSVLWSATALDWLSVSEDERRAALGEVRAGTVLLAHDGFAGPEDGADAATPPMPERVAWIEQFLGDSAELGLVGRSLSRALETGRPIKTLRVALPWRPLERAA